MLTTAPVYDLEVTKRIRSSGTDKGVPVFALTSYAMAMAGDNDKALKAGCAGQIEKPINPDTFMEDIEKYLYKQDGF